MLENLLLFGLQREGHSSVVSLLIQNGADLNVRDNTGRTAVIWASRNGHSSVMSLLIEKGADWDVRGYDGRTALIWAFIWASRYETFFYCVNSD